MHIKVVVHLKSGKKLTYSPTVSREDAQTFWRKSLVGEGTMSFGRFVVPKSEIEHVEFLVD